MKKIAAIAGVFGVYLALVIYFGLNVHAWLVSWLENINFWIYWGIWIVIAFSFFIGRIGHQWLLFSVIGAYWFAFLQYAIILFPLANLVSLLMDWPQEAFVIGNVVAALFSGIFVIGSYLAYSPVTRELEISVNQEPSDSLHIVVGSDFHLGVLSGKRHLRRFVERTNRLKPDMVLLAGDLVDDDPIWYARYGMQEEMKQLKAPLGVYGVLGNHEYYGKKIPLLVRVMENSGVRILRDETILVANRLYLTGREDETNGKRQALELLAPEKSLPWIVMDHTPSDLKKPAQLGADFHISGHTHKGQMWPNRFFTRKIFELDYGYRLIGKTHFLVSSGFGFWGPPIRIGSRSELWSIKMKFEKVT